MARRSTHAPLPSPLKSVETFTSVRVAVFMRRESVACGIYSFVAFLPGTHHPFAAHQAALQAVKVMLHLGFPPERFKIKRLGWADVEEDWCTFERPVVEHGIQLLEYQRPHDPRVEGQGKGGKPIFLDPLPAD